MTNRGSMDMKDFSRLQLIHPNKSLTFSNSGSRDLPWIVCIRRLQKAGWQGAAGASQGKGIFPFQLAFESMKRFVEEERKLNNTKHRKNHESSPFTSISVISLVCASPLKGAGLSERIGQVMKNL